jgi:hypothetical protein
MPVGNNGYWYVDNKLLRAPAPPWTQEELTKLARAFIDLDLDGPPLYQWCARNGLRRTPGAIDARLVTMGLVPAERADHVTRRPLVNGVRNKAEAAEKARRNLANQIKLAKMEAETAPLFRPPW